MRPIHFLHIRKTGGNAITYALNAARDRINANRVFHPHATRLCDIAHGEPVCFIVRDPVERFISGFNSRLRAGKPRHDIPWSSAEAAVFLRFHRPRELAAALSSPNQETRQRAVEAMAAIDHLSHPLRFWLTSAEYLDSRRDDILWVGRTSALAQDFKRLKAALGLPEILATLPDDPGNAHRHPPSDDTGIDEEDARNVRDWYRDDVAVLDYCYNKLIRLG